MVFNQIKTAKGPQPPRTAGITPHQGHHTIDLNADELDDQERPTRDRKKKFFGGGGGGGHRYYGDLRNLQESGSQMREVCGQSVAESDRFNSLIMAKRIKNENSRQL